LTRDTSALSELMAPPRPAPVPPSRPATPAEEARANLPDATVKVQQTIDRAHRIWAAPTLEDGDRIRREPRAGNVDEAERVRRAGTANGEEDR